MYEFFPASLLRLVKSSSIFIISPEAPNPPTEAASPNREVEKVEKSPSLVHGKAEVDLSTLSVADVAAAPLAAAATAAASLEEVQLDEGAPNPSKRDLFLLAMGQPEALDKKHYQFLWTKGNGKIRSGGGKVMITYQLKQSSPAMR